MDLDEHRYRRGYFPGHWEMEELYELPGARPEIPAPAERPADRQDIAAEQDPF